MQPSNVTLCMIVCDEEKDLPICLESVKGIVREIVIVDTGSQDCTVNIARKYGAIVVEHKWENNFAKARNAGLMYATSDWILVLDADETLHVEKQYLQSLLTEGMRAYYVKIKSYYGKKKDITRYMVDYCCRLFKNEPFLTYRGAIHEDITYAFSQEQIQFTNIVIEHTGYLEEEVYRKEKESRNMKILKRTLEKHCDDAYMQYAYATEFFQHEKYKEALLVYVPLLFACEQEAFFSDLVIKTIYSYMGCMQYENALKLIEQYQERFLDFPDFFYAKSIILLKMNKYTEGEKAINHCLETCEHEHYYSTSSEVSKESCLLLLALVAERKYAFKEVQEYYKQLVAHSNHEDLKYRYLKILCITSTQKEILDEIEKIFSLLYTDAMQMLEMLKFLAKTGEVSLLQSVLQKSLCADQRFFSYKIIGESYGDLHTQQVVRGISDYSVLYYLSWKEGIENRCMYDWEELSLQNGIHMKQVLNILVMTNNWCAFLSVFKKLVIKCSLKDIVDYNICYFFEKASVDHLKTIEEIWNQHVRQPLDYMIGACLALASHKKKRAEQCFYHLMQCNIFDLEQYKKSNGEITKIDWSRLLKIFLYIHSR